MALSDTNRRAGPFVGNGVVTTFPFAFRLLEDEDLRVTRTPLANLLAPVLLTLNIDYTIVRTPNMLDTSATGSVVLTTALATGQQLDVIGDAAYKQPLRLNNQGAYNAVDVMTALDRGVVLSQQLREVLGRAIVVPPQYNITDFGNLVQDIQRLAAVAAGIAALGAIINELIALAAIAGDLAAVGALAAAAIAASAAATAASATAAAAAAATAASLAAFIAKFTVSTALPSGGAEGDIWFRITV